MVQSSPPPTLLHSHLVQHRVYEKVRARLKYYQVGKVGARALWLCVWKG